MSPASSPAHRGHCSCLGLRTGVSPHFSMNSMREILACGDGYERGLIPLPGPIASAAQDSANSNQFDTLSTNIVRILRNPPFFPVFQSSFLSSTVPCADSDTKMVTDLREWNSRSFHFFRFERVSLPRTAPDHFPFTASADAGLRNDPNRREKGK